MSTTAYNKEIVVDDGSTQAELGATQVKHNLKNKLSNSPIAQENSGQTKSLALNLNRITEQYTFTLKVDDEVAQKLNASASTDTYTGDGTTQTFSLSQITGNEIARVNGSYIAEDRYTIDEKAMEITFDSPIADGATLEIVHALTKEMIKDRILTIYKSQEEVTVQYGSETPTGFLKSLEITENADTDTSVYTFKMTLVIADNMEEESGGS